MLHGSGVAGIVVGSVIVAVPAGGQDAGEGLQGGVGDLGEHGGLAAGLVPQDLQVEGMTVLEPTLVGKVVNMFDMLRAEALPRTPSLELM